MAKKNVQGAPEEVTVALNKSEAFFNKNKKAIIGAAIAIVLIIVAVFCYNNYYAAPREDKASTELAKAQNLFVQDAYDKAAPEFEKIISDFSGTKAANLAKLYAGLCYAYQEKWEEAVKHLEAFSTKDDSMISPAAMAALGNAYAHTGNIDKAVSSLEKAASMADDKSAYDANSVVSATFLIQAAQLLESQNKNEEALKIYKNVKATYVNAPQVMSMEIDKYIERLSQK